MFRVNHLTLGRTSLGASHRILYPRDLIERRSILGYEYLTSQYCKTAATFRYVRSDGLSGFPGVFMCYAFKVHYRTNFIHNGLLWRYNPLLPPRMGSRAPPPPPCPASRRLSCRDLNSRRTYSDVCDCGLVLTHTYAGEAAETIRTDVSGRCSSLTVL